MGSGGLIAPARVCTPSSYAAGSPTTPPPDTPHAKRRWSRLRADLGASCLSASPACGPFSVARPRSATALSSGGAAAPSSPSTRPSRSLPRASIAAIIGASTSTPRRSRASTCHTGKCPSATTLYPGRVAPLRGLALPRLLASSRVRARRRADRGHRRGQALSVRPGRSAGGGGIVPCGRRRSVLFARCGHRGPLRRRH